MVTMHSCRNCAVIWASLRNRSTCSAFSRHSGRRSLMTTFRLIDRWIANQTTPMPPEASRRTGSKASAQRAGKGSSIRIDYTEDPTSPPSQHRYVIQVTVFHLEVRRGIQPGERFEIPVEVGLVVVA